MNNDLVSAHLEKSTGVANAVATIDELLVTLPKIKLYNNFQGVILRNETDMLRINFSRNLSAELMKSAVTVSQALAYGVVSQTFTKDAAGNFNTLKENSRLTLQLPEDYGSLDWAKIKAQAAAEGKPQKLISFVKSQRSAAEAFGEIK